MNGDGEGLVQKETGYITNSTFMAEVGKRCSNRGAAKVYPPMLVAAIIRRIRTLMESDKILGVSAVRVFCEEGECEWEDSTTEECEEFWDDTSGAPLDRAGVRAADKEISTREVKKRPVYEIVLVQQSWDEMVESPTVLCGST